MTERRTLRVRALRNQRACALEWHPDDHADAVAFLGDHHHRVITALYSAVDRRHVSNGDVVARVEVWPRSGEIEDLTVDEQYRRESATAPVEDLELAGSGGASA